MAGVNCETCFFEFECYNRDVFVYWSDIDWTLKVVVINVPGKVCDSFEHSGFESFDGLCRRFRNSEDHAKLA